MGKVVLVISWNQPETMDESFEKLNDIAAKVRTHLEERPDILVHTGIKGVADSVLAIFEP